MFKNTAATILNSLQTRLDTHCPNWLAETIKEIFSIVFNLFKLMIPVLIIVKIIEELGGIKYIAMALEPVMELVGLPASMGIVWATTMLSNMYSGMIIFVSASAQETLSVAQVTVLGTMMLLAHSLPIEVRVAQKAGVRILFTLLLRVGGALLIGFILHQIYSSSDYLNQTNSAIWQPPSSGDDSILTWIINQLKTFWQIFLIVSVLVVFLRLLKLSGIEKLIILLLKPLLMLMGLSEKTTTITIIGITLGLTFGGGLLINEAQKGDISKAEVFGSLSLLAICHSLIEDTILIMLLGADLSGILYFRLLFSIIVIGIIIRLVRQLDQTVFSRYFVYPTTKQ